MSLAVPSSRLRNTNKYNNYYNKNNNKYFLHSTPGRVKRRLNSSDSTRRGAVSVSLSLSQSGGSLEQGKFKSTLLDGNGWQGGKRKSSTWGTSTLTDLGFEAKQTCDKDKDKDKEQEKGGNSSVFENNGGGDVRTSPVGQQEYMKKWRLAGHTAVGGTEVVEGGFPNVRRMAIRLMKHLQ